MEPQVGAVAACERTRQRIANRHLLRICSWRRTVASVFAVTGMMAVGNDGASPPDAVPKSVFGAFDNTGGADCWAGITSQDQR